MKTIVIILLILYIGAVICINILMYKMIKESCESKDWELITFYLMMSLAEILLGQSLAVMFFIA